MYKTLCLTPRAGLLSSFMFLQALLFFLLGTSVFAGALAKGSNTEVARVARDDPQHQAVVEAQKPHIGLWYPSEASVKVVSRVFLISSQVSHPCRSLDIALFRFSLAKKLDFAGYLGITAQF